MHAPIKPLLLAVSMTIVSLSAQAAGPVAPGAGSILQQIQPPTPPLPPSAPALTIERQDAGQLPETISFAVKHIEISGNTAFDSQTLHALVADGEGKTLTLAQLEALAARITDYYHRHGYPLARAIVPPQAIQSGTVRIEVIEAHYGQIKLDNSSRVVDGPLIATLAPLQSGQIITQAAMNRSLLLLSDIPGIVVDATLSPGTADGTSDLLVNTTPGPAAAGGIALDDYGNRYTGRVRLGGNLAFNNALHQGDLLSLNALSSGNDLNYGRAAYQYLLNGQGTHFGISYSALRYILGGPLASLKANGTAQIGSLWLSQPFVRTPNANLYGQIQYDHQQMRDHIDTSDTHTDRHTNGWTASLNGDTLDTFLSGGVNNYSANWTAGQLGFDNAVAQSVDAATARTQGGFSKWNVNLTRLQRLSRQDGLYLSFSGQWANTNLDPVEQMIAGGPYSVRAYDMGAVAGDAGYLATAELRHTLALSLYGQWQAVAFLDSEHVTINRNLWVAGINDATLSGAGVGLNWSGPNQWTAKAYIAAPIGSTPVLVGNTASVRAWLLIAKNL